MEEGEEPCFYGGDTVEPVMVVCDLLRVGRIRRDYQRETSPLGWRPPPECQ